MESELQIHTRNRPLTDQERRLATWMLEHGKPEAHAFLLQLKNAQVTPVRCPRGCPSVRFQIAGYPPASLGINILADFMFGTIDDPKGIFIYENDGILSGLEVSSYGGDVTKLLPSIEELKPVGSTISTIKVEADRGPRQDFDRFLAAVPHREPTETDRLPSQL